MAKLSEDIFLKMVERRYFDEWKTLKDVVKKLSQSGYTIKEGRKKGLVAQFLTYLCQKEILEREELSKNEWQTAGGKWKYRKVKP